MRWIAIEAISQGHAAHAGMPTNGMNRNATRPAPTEINVVVDSGSRPTLISAFQPAWQAAANKTARKTTFSISVCVGSFDERRGWTTRVQAVAARLRRAAKGTAILHRSNP